MPVNHIPVIAIDGPSASGKGSVAEIIADKLGYHYLDSGALYRIVALAAQNHGTAWNDPVALGALVSTLNIAFKNRQVHLNGDNVTDAIRTPAMSDGASQVAVHPEVRDALLALQHSFRKMPGLVAEGRDMTSIVFENASLKIFLTANVEERANRRCNQLANRNIAADYKKILHDLQERDNRDSTRTSSPLVQTKDAILLDTDNRNIDEAVAFVLSEYKKLVSKQ